MADAIRSIFRYARYVVEDVTRLVDDEVHPDEWRYIRGAVPKRRAEFGTARLCARRALRAMGVPPTSLVPGEDRAPQWPPGVVGSITHTGAYCAVVVDRNPPLRSVGLDAETLRILEPRLVRMILTENEQSWIRSQPKEELTKLATLFFSAKEAYYKCQYPLTKTTLDFSDVEIDIEPGRGRFVARALRWPFPVDLARLEGRFAYEGGRVLCGVELLE
jgi:enterobactin synthetase component D / holo-[acyl-carrier protein] synthase